MMTADQLSDIATRLCPMHVLLDAKGHIQRVGPTLQKLRPDLDWTGEPFLEAFELRRPRSIQSMDDLVRTSGVKLHLQFRDNPQTGLKGVLAPLPDGMGAFVDLSFGISVLDAVRDYDLTSADFSATDLTIEMLYLVEAKSAAMEASRQLNLRLQGAKIAAEEQAFTDTLTGLKNRRAMDHILERLINAGRGFALMQVDLDFFKAVNDTMGHAAGDAVLQKVASIMVESTRSSDTVARVGGDEFVLIFDGILDKSRLANVADRLIKKLEEPIPFGGQMCRISASIGTILSPVNDGSEATRLLHEADVALYAAKRAGRACHFFYEPSLDTENSADDQAEGGAQEDSDPKVAEGELTSLSNGVGSDHRPVN